MMMYHLSFLFKKLPLLIWTCGSLFCLPWCADCSHFVWDWVRHAGIQIQCPSAIRPQVTRAVAQQGVAILRQGPIRLIVHTSSLPADSHLVLIELAMETEAYSPLSSERLTAPCLRWQALVHKDSIDPASEVLLQLWLSQWQQWNITHPKETHANSTTDSLLSSMLDSLWSFER